jgi:hypothetical protein
VRGAVLPQQSCRFNSVHVARRRTVLKKLLVATITAFLALTASNAVIAQEQGQPKEKFLVNFAAAMVLTFKCKSWKINASQVELLMGLLRMTTKDISPGGSDWLVFRRSMLQAKSDTKDLDAKAMCDAAEGMFGPKGTFAPNLMVPTTPQRQ